MPVLLTLLIVLGAAPQSLPTNRTWEQLPPASTDAELRQAVAVAGARLGDWSIDFTGLELDGPALEALARKDPDRPFTQVVREALARPVDVPDFVLFLDDLLEAGDHGLRGQPVWIGAGRARSAGILLHPDDVFTDTPRRYGEDGKPLPIDEPEDQSSLEPAEDGEPLGPRWSARFKNPDEERARLAALARKAPDFARRVQSLIDQLRAQGADVTVTSALRSRARGYLMWGSFVLSQARTRRQLDRSVAMLRRYNRRWDKVPIRWRAAGGWRATVEAARQMKESYDVVYATRRGAQKSDHYEGRAVDLVAFGLPRALTLTAPDGATQTFDLSDPNESRDLSLTEPLIEWVEAHFDLKKLRSDYPHWEDAAP